MSTKELNINIPNGYEIDIEESNLKLYKNLNTISLTNTKWNTMWILINENHVNTLNIKLLLE